MENQYCCNLQNLLDLFDEKISVADILASKALADVSAEIVKQRLELGMTQKQFAHFMNVSQGMVSKWESADYNFSVKALAEIAEKLDLELEVRLQKPKVIPVFEDEKGFRCITPTARHFFVVKNNSSSKRTCNRVKQYVENLDALKIVTH